MKPGSLVELVSVGIWEAEKAGYMLLYPRNKKIYTIREIITIGGVVGLRFEELLNPPIEWRDGVYEIAFNIREFRELQPPMEISIENILEQELV